MRSASGNVGSISCSAAAERRNTSERWTAAAAARCNMLQRLRSTVTPSRLMLGACLGIAAWLVFVPLAALFYNAFTEDTGFGPGELSLANFVEAYSGWHILRLLRNSLLFAAASA